MYFLTTEVRWRSLVRRGGGGGAGEGGGGPVVGGRPGEGSGVVVSHLGRAGYWETEESMMCRDGTLMVQTLYRASDHVQTLSRCQSFQAYQITDQSGDTILGGSTDRPIRCRVSLK